MGLSIFLTFIVDFSQYGYVYLLSHRYEALDLFKRFIAAVETQLDRIVKTLRTDCGREYLSQMFKDFYEQKGIRRQLRIPRTTHQNGVAKRSNLTLLDMVKSIMAERKSIPVTPYELWHGRKPFLAHLRPWSSTGYVHNLTHKH